MARQYLMAYRSAQVLLGIFFAFCGTILLGIRVWRSKRIRRDLRMIAVFTIFVAALYTFAAAHSAYSSHWRELPVTCGVAVRTGVRCQYASYPAAWRTSIGEELRRRRPRGVLGVRVSGVTGTPISR